MDLTLRPLSTSQVLDRTFSLYRQNFLLFAGITALPAAIPLVGQLLLLLITRPVPGGPLESGDPLKMGAALGAAFLGAVVLFALLLAGYAFAAGATVGAVSRVHLGHTTTIGECYRLIKPHFWSIVGIVVLVGACVGAVIFVAALFVIIPVAMAFAGGGRPNFTAGIGLGIFLGSLAVIAAFILAFYISTKFSLSVPACLLENLGVIESMKRSWRLTEGTVLRMILVSILAAVIAWVLSMVLSIPYFIGIGMMITRKNPNPNMLLPFIAWQYVANFLARSLAGPVGTIAAALIYYDQRVRKEAFDLQLIMQAIGQQPPSPQAASVASPGSMG
jgi:MFS family permease